MQQRLVEKPSEQPLGVLNSFADQDQPWQERLAFDLVTDFGNAFFLLGKTTRLILAQRRDRLAQLFAAGDELHPAIIDTLVRMLLVDARAAEVRVTDNPIESPADCFAKSGIGAAAEQAGGRVYLPDPNAFDLLYTPGATLIEQWTFLKRPFKNVNKVIGIAPAKDHNLCHASLGIKNWYGLLGGRRNQFHQDIHEIVSDLSIMIRPTLTIVDGTRVLMENGPTGGDPSNVRDGQAILVGVDPVATDAWAFEHLLQRPGRLPDYLYMAEQKGSGKVNYKDRIKVIT